MIQHVAFNHGLWYHYRLHTARLQRVLLEFPQLHRFLSSVSAVCPHEKFFSGPRSSKLRLVVPVTLTELRGHELCTLAATSLTYSSERTAHTKVELGLLAADEKTLSVEVPLWLHATELEQFEALFASSESLTGHIDILRVENGKVWIWDFKPKAHKEKWAATQINCYAAMLSVRTGIPLDDFMCGYFDEHTSFVFKPVPLQQLLIV